MIQNLIASAPGKLILFGEHSVVYGKGAIAASLDDLRCLVELKVIDLPEIHIILSDISNEVTKIKLSLLSEIISKSKFTGFTPTPIAAGEIAEVFKQKYLEMNHQFKASHRVICPTLLLIHEMIPSLFSSNESSRTNTKGIEITASTSVLPIGAGLGSSAAFSVALASVLHMCQDSRSELCKCTKNDNKRSSKNKELNPCVSCLELINCYAFAMETVLHGNPSGIDNTISTFGGSIYFEKSDSKPKFQRLDYFPKEAFEIMLTNTGVSRDTKEVVDAVRCRRKRFTKIYENTFECMDNICQDALFILKQINSFIIEKENGSLLLDEAVEITSIGGVSGEDIVTASRPRPSTSSAADYTDDKNKILESHFDLLMITKLLELVRLNQCFLNAIGVGHPSIDFLILKISNTIMPQEEDKDKNDSSIGGSSNNYHTVLFESKLTGAGAGGCILTLFRRDNTGYYRSKLATLRQILKDINIETYMSRIAGQGVFIRLK